MKMKRAGAYVLGKTLGKGTFGKVKQATHSVTGQQVAIKILDAVATKDLEREVRVLKLLKHPNIVKLSEVFTENRKMYIVLELVTGGELFDRIVRDGFLSENESRRLFRQMLSAIEYCHGNLIAHRDLKPENMLMDTEGNIKITDFGFSNFMRGGESFHTMCGSPIYTAPEVLMSEGYAGTQSDVWSLGVVLFAMVAGHLPWSCHNSDIQTILRALYSGFDIPNHLSIEVSHLLKRMISPDPTKRITLEEVKKHPWVNKGFAGPPPCYLEQRVAIDRVNEEILMLMAPFEFNIQDARKSILANEQCLATSIYHLLYEQKYPQSPKIDPRVSILMRPEPNKRRYTISEGSVKPIIAPVTRARNYSVNPSMPTVKEEGEAPKPSVETSRKNFSRKVLSIFRKTPPPMSPSVRSPSPSPRRRFSVDTQERSSTTPASSDSESDSSPRNVRRLKLAKNMFEVLGKSSEEIALMTKSLLADLHVEYTLSKDLNVFHCTHKTQIQAGSAAVSLVVVNFDIEVCVINKAGDGAVKIKRRSGDVWVYKPIFTLLASGLKTY